MQEVATNKNAVKINFLSLLIIFVTFVVHFVFLENGYDYANQPKGAVIQISALLFLIFFLIQKIWQKDYRIKTNNLLLYFTIFIVWMLITYFYAVNKYHVLYDFGGWFASLIFIFLIINVFSKKKEASYLLYTIYIASFLCSLFGILQFYFNIQLIYQAMPPASFFANKNMASHITIISIPIGIVSVFKYQDIRKKIFFALTSALMFVFLVYANSRAAWLSFAVELTIIFIVLIKKKLLRIDKKQLLPILMFLLIILFMISLSDKYKKKNLINFNYIDKVKSITEIKTNSQIQQRLILWGNTLKMIKDNFLFGVGKGNFAIRFTPYNASLYSTRTIVHDVELIQVQASHNDFLQMFSEIGFIGISFSFLLIISFLKAIISLIGSKDLKVSYTFIGILSGTIGILTNSIFSFPFQLFTPIFLFSLYIAITSIYYNKNKEHHIHKSSLIALTIILVPLFLWAVKFHIGNTKFQTKLLEAQQDLFKNNIIGGLEHAKETTEANPYDIQGCFVEGVIYLRLGNFQKAHSIFSKVLEVHPYSTITLLQLSLLYMKMRDYKKAKEVLDTLLLYKPTSVKVRHLSFQNYLKLSKPNEAIRELRIANRLDPNNLIVLKSLGNFHSSYKEYRQAEMYYEKCLSLNKNNMECQKGLRKAQIGLRRGVKPFR